MIVPLASGRQEVRTSLGCEWKVSLGYMRPWREERGERERIRKKKGSEVRRDKGEKKERKGKAATESRISGSLTLSIYTISGNLDGADTCGKQYGVSSKHYMERGEQSSIPGTYLVTHNCF